MKQILLATALIVLPVGVFTAVYAYEVRLSGPARHLGDLAAMRSIVTDAQALAATGDMAAAELRATDFESAWDGAEPSLRPMDPAAWGNVDAAADASFAALRAAAPDPAQVASTLAALVASLDDPAAAGTASAGGPRTVSGVAVTDANGHALPCEDMLRSLDDALSGTGVTDAAVLAQASDLRASATERCNADDDTRADAFSAQAPALLAS